MIGRWLCGRRGLLLGPLVVALCAPPSFAGKLDDFERSATEDSKGSDDHGRSDRGDDHDYSDDADGMAAIVLVVLLIPIYGGTQAWARVAGGSGLGDETPEPRRAGEAMLPFARIDAAYQLVESDVDAWDVRGELGFGPFAIEGRETHYEEDHPDDDLDLVQAHALLRMSFLDALEVDLGIGGLVLAGDSTASGVSGTVPILIHPWDFLGLEFRPTWAGVNGNTLSDYDLSLLAGWRFISARVGYRWTESAGSSLNGPIFGFAARW